MAVLPEPRFSQAKSHTMLNRPKVTDLDEPQSRLDAARAALLAGDYRTGWRDFEWRLRGVDEAPPSANLLVTNLPRWDGSNPAGRTILVVCEPDVGDCIQFARYLPLLSGRGARVVVACPESLTRLLSGIPGVEVVLPTDPLPPADVHVPIGSLPLLFETTPATIPTFDAYLRPPTALVQAWRQRFFPIRNAGKRIIGLALSRYSDHSGDLDDRLRQDQVDTLMRSTDTHFVALDGLELADAAAAISLLDFVITTESPIAHLAGALGKPARVLVRHSPDWCWQAEGDDTAWYPSVRLLRQPAPGDWNSPIRELVEFLNPRGGRAVSRPAA